MNTSEIKPKDKIEDCYGEWHTVAWIDGNSIFTTDQVHIHITKVMKVKKQ